jgi:hypothetical protein
MSSHSTEDINNRLRNFSQSIKKKPIQEISYNDEPLDLKSLNDEQLNNTVELFNDFSESLKAKKYIAYKTSIDNVGRLPTQKYNPLSNFFINTNINNPTNLAIEVTYPPITIN